MVLIWTKEKWDRVDIIIVPKQILKIFLESHVERKFKINETKTCLVTKDNDWTGIPTDEQIIKLLQESLHSIRLVEGFDKRFDIPHHIFNIIKCKEFVMTKNGAIPSSDIFEGDFKITLTQIYGRSKKANEILRKNPWISYNTSIGKEIIFTYEKFKDRYPKEFGFIIEHIYPVAK